jgi:hypothetical protein
MDMRQSICCVLAVAGCLPTACATRAPLRVPDPAPRIAAPDEPGITIILAWDAPVDLDLYVTDPTWETVYFGNNPSRSGARLTRDMRCTDTKGEGPFREIARIAAPAPGGYRVGVDFIERCSGELEQVSFRIAAVLQGAPALEKTATIQLDRFLSRVADYRFDGTRLVPSDVTGDGP